MLVKINLLPKKEPKNVTLWVIGFSALFILLVAGSILLWQGSRLDEELTAIENDIMTTKQLIEAEEAKQAQNQGSASFAELGSAVTWANEEPLKSVPIISHIVTLLPQRGFIQEIAYKEAGAINLSVQFDTSRDSAYFLKRLLDSDWVGEAKLTTLSTDNPEADEEDTQSSKVSDVLPRYTGTFEIMLSRDYINQEERLKSVENNPVGGDES